MYRRCKIRGSFLSAVLFSHYYKPGFENMIVLLCVPDPVLRWTPPRQLEEFHTVISAQACVRSAACRPSYTIVWLNTGLTEPRTTRVCWPLTPLSSGKITLQHTIHTSMYLIYEDTCKCIPIISY